MLPPLARHERKFLPEGITLAEFLSRLRRHPALFREIHHERPVNSLYFDTHDLRHYEDHIHGHAHRMKIRLRWYGDFHGPTEPRLEFKCRHGLEGSKMVFSLPTMDVAASLNHFNRSTPPEFAQLPELTNLRMRTVQPTVANRYRRRYFITADHHLRLTVDWALQFMDPRHPGAGFKTAHGCAPTLVVELKYDPVHAPIAAEVTNGFPFRLTRCSKYVLGVECVGRAFSDVD